MSDENKIRLRFLEQRRESVKQLPGFQKHHRVPTSASASDTSFVASLAEPLLDKDLQETFSSLRKSFGLKRKEIRVDGPFEGSGIIETPFFCYRIEVAIDPDSPSRVIFTRSIIDITEPARVVAPPFEEVFQKRHSIRLAISEDCPKNGLEFAYPTQTTFTAAPDGKLVMPYAAPKP